MLWTACALAASPLVLEAPTLVVDDGLLSASDGVTVQLPSLGTLSASGLLADDTRWTFHEGDWQRPEGSVTFEQAVYDVASGVVTLSGAQWTLHGRTLAAGGVAWRSDHWLATELSYDPCACDTPSPVRFTAAEVRDAGPRIDLRDARLTVGARTWLRVPRLRLPVERASGFLLPTVQRGQDGLIVTQPLYLAPRPTWDLTLTPELRSKLGVRGRTEARWDDGNHRGEADLTVAWAPTQPAVSGVAGSWRERGAVGGATLATQGTAWSDPAVAQRWGGDTVLRGSSWTEQRAWLGRAGVGLWTDRLKQGDQVVADGTLTTPIGLHLQDERPLGAGRATVATLATAALAVAPDGSAVGAGATAGLGLTHSAWTGPLRWDAAIAGRATGSWLNDLDAGLDTRSSLGVALPVWRADRGALTSLELGGAVGHTGSDRDLAPLARLHLRADRTTSDAQLSAQSGLTVQRGVATLTTDLQVHQPRFRTQLAALTTSEAPLSPQIVAVAGPRFEQIDVGAVLWWVPVPDSDPLQRTGLSTTLRGPGRLSAWSTAADVLYDVGAQEITTRGARLGWTHRSGCIAIGASVRSDADRVGPDLGLTLTLVP